MNQEPSNQKGARTTKAGSHGVLQAPSLAPTKPPTPTARHSTHPPVPCLGRTFLIQNVSKALTPPIHGAPAAPPGGRFWHGFAVRLAGRDARVGTGAELGWTNWLRPWSPFADRGGMRRKATEAITFFTDRTLAAYLAVSDRTIRNWIRRGELPSYKLGASRRIDPADVEDFLARHRDEVA